jgi:F-type H+/Na+-transporting ATPase subunit beta
MNGLISSIQGQIVEVDFTGSELPHMHQLLRVSENKTHPLLEVHGYRENRTVQTVALGPVIGLSRGLNVHPLPDRELSEGNLLGLVVDGIGRIMIDEKNEVPHGSHSIFTRSRKPAQHSNRGPAASLDAGNVISTNILAIDIFSPIIRGSKVGILGGAGVGKTVLMTAIAQSFLQGETNGVAVFAGVGERIREAHELLTNLPPKLRERSVFVFGQMDRNAGERFRAAHTAVDVAEHYRDEGRNVLLFMDNIFRFVQAGAEISTMLGRMPSVLGYQPTLELELGELQERLCTFEGGTGSITSIECVYMPSDDLTDPAINAISRHMATTIVLDRDLVPSTTNASTLSSTSVPRYPAMDVLKSKTRIAGTTLEALAGDLRKILQRKMRLEVKIKYHLSTSAEAEFFNKGIEIEKSLNQKYRKPEEMAALAKNKTAAIQEMRTRATEGLELLSRLDHAPKDSQQH